jgi:hypothetical protein
VLFDLFNIGIIDKLYVVYTLSGCLIIIGGSYLLYRLRVTVSFYRFSFFLLLYALICIVIPVRTWLPFTLCIISLYIFGGIFIGIISYRAGFNTLLCTYMLSPKLAFTGSKEECSLFFNNASCDKHTISLRFFNTFGIIKVDGTDSPHCSIVEESIISTRRSEQRLIDKIPVRFVLRGYDQNSSLYYSVCVKFPLSLIMPFSVRYAGILPEIPVLTATFAPLAGKSRLINREEKITQHPTEKVSRIKTDSFLHISPYSPGESLSQIDFKASARVGEIVSRKYSKTIDLSCLVALGFGKRAMADRTGERLMAELGTVLSDNVSLGFSTDVCVFDVVKRYNKRIGTGRGSALGLGKELASLHPTHYEEDELCILDGLGRSIRDYTHLRIIISWGGHFDISRTIHMANLFRKNGVDCEIRVIASVVFDVLNQRKNQPAYAFFIKMMNKAAMQARKSGVRLLWVEN